MCRMTLGVHRLMRSFMLLLMLFRATSAVVCDATTIMMPNDLFDVPDCVVEQPSEKIRHYLLRVGSATSHIKMSSSWCGDARELACYLIGLEAQNPPCVYDNDRSGRIDKLRSLTLFETGLQPAWPKPHDRRHNGKHAHLMSKTRRMYF